MNFHHCQQFYSKARDILISHDYKNPNQLKFFTLAPTKNAFPIHLFQIMIKYLIGLQLLLIGISLVESDSSVQFLNQFRQLYTSSTLKWVSAKNGEVPINAVVGAFKNYTSKSNIFAQN